MADVKWIKITVDMFDNRKIKHLRKLPDGNNLVLIWVMLLTIAGRCNANGMIFLTENFPYSTKMLADELDFEENTIKLALNVFEMLGMVKLDGDYMSITGWDEYQNTDKLSEIREYNRLAKQKERARKKQITLVNDNVNDKSMTSQPCQDTDIDIDKDIDIDIYINNKGDSEKPDHVSESTFKDEFDHLWKLYPNKKGSKKKAFESYKRARKKGTTFEAVEKGINDYVLYIQINNIDIQYVKHGSTFFNQNSWEAQWLPDNVEIVEDDGLDGIL